MEPAQHLMNKLRKNSLLAPSEELPVIIF